MRTKLAYTALAVLTALLLATNPVIADAAGQITGKDIKNSSISGKDIKDKSIGVDDMSPAAVQALHGANGTNGTNGAAGASAFAPPPAGTVINGGGILNSYVSAAGTNLRNYSELPFTTKTPLIDADGPGTRNLYFGTSTSAGPGEANPTLCPGTFAAPTAAPGVLCVYLGAATNITTSSTFIYSGANADAADTDGANGNGFYIVTAADAAGTMLLRYTWAYTAN